MAKDEGGEVAKEEEEVWAGEVCAVEKLDAW
jgi:hypothetical protein